MVRLVPTNNRTNIVKTGPSLSPTEKPRLFPIHSNGSGNTTEREQKVSRLDEFQPRWWGNVHLQTK